MITALASSNPDQSRETQVTSASALPTGHRVISLDPAEIIERDGTYQDSSSLAELRIVLQRQPSLFCIGTANLEVSTCAGESCIVVFRTELEL